MLNLDNFRIVYNYKVIIYFLAIFSILFCIDNACADIVGEVTFPVTNFEVDDYELKSDVILSKNFQKQRLRTSHNSGEVYTVARGLLDIERIPEPKAGTLRLASWNMHDLFDTIDDCYKDEVLTNKEFSEKIASLSAVLKCLKADIIGVQEVEKEESLRILATRSGYPYVLLVPGNDKYRGINVGVMSKVPIKNYVTHIRDYCLLTGKRHRFSRDCLEVHFDHPSKLVMLVNHFKSKRGKNDSSSTSKRLAQAMRVHSIASTLSKYPVIIVGDLNDEPNSKALSPLLRDPNITDALSWIGRARVTFSKGKYNSALDYLLLNKTLALKMVRNSATIVVGDKVGKASDHRPVYVDVKL